MPPNIFVCLPAFGRQCSSETTASLIHSVAALMTKQIGFLFGSLSYPDISELRNAAATIFFDTMPECTHLFMIDADMIVPPNLILDFVAFNKPFCAGSYRHKADEVTWVGNDLDGPPQIENGYLKRRDVGAGAMLIRRDCLEQILMANPKLADYRLETHSMRHLLKDHGVKRILRFFDKIETDHGILSEDLAFCKRVRDCGVDVWASLNHEVGHIGLKNFSGSYGQYLKERSAKGNG